MEVGKISRLQKYLSLWKVFMRKKILILLCFLAVPIFMFSCKNVDAPLKITKVSKYNIDVVLNEDDHTLNCTQTVSTYNGSQDDLELLKFHLYPKAFKVGAINPSISSLYTAKAYPNGESFGDITIEQCKVNSIQNEFYFEGSDKEILVIPLEDKLESGKYQNIEIEYNVVLPNINHRFGYGNKTINLGNFYPILCVYEDGSFSTKPYSVNGDPFYSDVSNYSVSIKYPSHYVLAHTGNLIENTEDGLYRITKIKADNVRDFAMTMSVDFQIKTKDVDGTTVNYYYYSDTEPESSFKACTDSLTTFNKLFGKYPYRQLSVCETNFVYGGMEDPNLVFISDDIDSHSDYINTIVHEIAHQWWYGMVGNDEFTYGWLDEGLTEYSTALFYEENPDYEITMQEIIKNTTNSYLLFIQVYTDVFGKCDTTMNRLLNEYDTEPEYVYIAYVKSVLLFNDIRELVGKEDFIKGLKLYFDTYKGKNVTPDNLIECIEKTSNKPIKDIFTSYIEGKVIIMANE